MLVECWLSSGAPDAAPATAVRCRTFAVALTPMADAESDVINNPAESAPSAATRTNDRRDRLVLAEWMCTGFLLYERPCCRTKEHPLISICRPFAERRSECARPNTAHAAVPRDGRAMASDI